MGDVYLQMGEYEKAMEFHQLDYDLSEAEEDNSGKVNITRKLAINCEFMVARIVINFEWLAQKYTSLEAP